jgi:hypothetical protein
MTTLGVGLVGAGRFGAFVSEATSDLPAAELGDLIPGGNPVTSGG